MTIKLVSSLEKVFLDEAPNVTNETCFNVVNLGDVFSFQAVIYLDLKTPRKNFADYEVVVESEIENIIKVRQVGHVPSRMPLYHKTDGDFLRDSVGLYPDPLEEKEYVRLFSKSWNSIWIDVSPTLDTKPGDFNITIKIKDHEGNVQGEAKTSVKILGISIPKAHFVHTEWFHTDCLAQYYNVPVFSDEYWRIVKNFMDTAVKMGQNMILTPVFTPPLDTAIGGERLTVQLVDVKQTPEGYVFCFDKLVRWIDLAREAGFEYFEISHLFTQWGAAHAPKIMVTNCEGVLIKKFGWETDAAGDEYVGFLKAFIPKLLEVLQSKQADDKAYFHISDEPSLKNIDQYKKIHSIIKPLLKNQKMFDALSDAAFYKEGLVEIPVVATDHYEDFQDFDIKERWVYYCSGQADEVSNRFFGYPEYRNRIIGVQLYLYEITGFLQWGLNFYNTRLSTKAIDPFAVTDAGMAFPSGDSFILYPGEKGAAWDSIRSMVFSAALSDFHALKHLESLAGREFVVNLICEGLSEKITFKKYPQTAEYLLKLKARVLHEIEKFKM